MLSDSRRDRYWRRNLMIISLLLLVWAGVTFGIAYYGRELSRIDFFGWPFPFWVGAQGSLICYVVIIAVYAGYMNRMDRKLEQEDDEADRNGQPPQQSEP